jgi:hypothetical protein
MRRRRVAFWVVVAAILLASYVIVTVLAPSGDDRGASSTAHPSVSAGECGRILRQLGNDVLDAITTPEPGASAAPTRVASVDPISAAECGRLLDATTTPDPAGSVR